MARDLDEHGFAEAHSRSRTNGVPIEAGDGDVLAGGTGLDGVTFGPQGFDDLKGEEAEGAFGTTVELRALLAVALDAKRSDDGTENGTLGHAAVGDVDVGDAGFGCHSTTLTRPFSRTTSRVLAVPGLGEPSV